MTNYVNIQNTCPLCRRPFQRFTYKVQCNGRCGRLFCASHVPLQNKAGWICPECKAAQAPFFSQNNPAAPATSAEPVSNITEMIQAASTLYQNQRSTDADRLLDDIFVSIFRKG